MKDPTEAFFLFSFHTALIVFAKQSCTWGKCSNFRWSHPVYVPVDSILCMNELVDPFNKKKILVQ